MYLLTWNEIKIVKDNQFLIFCTFVWRTIYNWTVWFYLQILLDLSEGLKITSSVGNLLSLYFRVKFLNVRLQEKKWERGNLLSHKMQRKFVQSVLVICRQLFYRWFLRICEWIKNMFWERTECIRDLDLN